MKKIYFLLLTLLISVSSIGQTTVFINEIHYDNAGADVNEGFEIAGPAGTNLTGWTVAKYNGSDGTVYGTEALSGTITDQENGMGTIWFGLPSGGMQNGPAEGLALVAADGTTVIQFLSYEGVVTATAGPANTMSSVNIGVSETDSTTINHSLQLSGTGNTYEDFTWSAPASHSRGGVNISQVFSAAGPTITANPTSISGFFYYENNGPSNEDTFLASGMNLITDITISAPISFEVSLSSGAGFSNSISLEQAEGTVEPTTIYVRMIAELTSDSYTGDIELTSINAADKTVALSGLVSPSDPQITMSGTISGLEYNEGSGPSPSDTFNVSGLFLTNNIVVTAPENFEVSLSEMTGYMESVTLVQESGTVENTTVYVRLIAGLSDGTYMGDIIASSSPAANKNLPVNGEVTNTLSNDLFESSDFAIYPNPTSTGFVNIRTNSGVNINVQIFNVLGKIVLNQSVSNKQLDVSTLKTGVYIIRISQDGNTATKKLIIK